MLNFINLLSPFEGFKSQAYYLSMLNTENYNFINLWNYSNFGTILDNVISFNKPSSIQFLISFLIIVYGTLSLSNWLKVTLIETNTFDKIKETFLSIFVASFIAIFLLNSQSILKETIILFNNTEDIVFLSSMKSNFLLVTVQEFWCLSNAIIAFYIISSKSLTNLKLYPSTFVDALSENFYTFTFNLFSDILGLKTVDEVKNHQVFFFKIYAIFFFNVFSNLGGMIPYSITFTSQLFVTFCLAYLVFFACTYTIISEKGLKYFFSLFLPQGVSIGLLFFLMPLEMLSYSSRVVSLGVRLFVNMMAGHVLLKVISGFALVMIIAGDFMILASFFPVLVLFLLTVLELAVALIQAYVFTVLTLLYLRDFFVAH